ncbi:hypothetical protein RCL1_006869 [Eukaryota sp. TZLM3-RCL]
MSFDELLQHHQCCHFSVNSTIESILNSVDVIVSENTANELCIPFVSQWAKQALRTSILLQPINPKLLYNRPTDPMSLNWTPPAPITPDPFCSSSITITRNRTGPHTTESSPLPSPRTLKASHSRKTPKSMLNTSTSLKGKTEPLSRPQMNNTLRDSRHQESRRKVEAQKQLQNEQETQKLALKKLKSNRKDWTFDDSGAPILIEPPQTKSSTPSPFKKLPIQLVVETETGVMDKERTTASEQKRSRLLSAGVRKLDDDVSPGKLKTLTRLQYGVTLKEPPRMNIR